MSAAKPPDPKTPGRSTPYELYSQRKFDYFSPARKTAIRRLFFCYTNTVFHHVHLFTARRRGKRHAHLRAVVRPRHAVSGLPDELRVAGRKRHDLASPRPTARARQQPAIH